MRALPAASLADPIGPLLLTTAREAFTSGMHAAALVAAIVLLIALIPSAAPFAYIVAGLAIAPIFPTGIVWLAKLRPGDARATSWLFPAAMVGGAVIPGGIGAVVARFGIGWAPAVLAIVAVGSLAWFSLAARYRSAA